MTTNPAQWATTVLRGHPSPGPVQQEPLEGTAKQQQLENASRAPQAPSVPCQDRQHVSPVGVLPSLPRVSPRALLASSGCAARGSTGWGSQEASSWISSCRPESGPECMQQGLQPALGQAEAASAHSAWPWGPAAMSVVRAAVLSPSMLWKQLPGPVF